MPLSKQLCWKDVDKFDMSNSKVVSTPLANHFKLSLDQCPKENAKVDDMSKVPYVSVVGCLMYVIICTLSNLAQVISHDCKFVSKSRNHNCIWTKLIINDKFRHCLNLLHVSHC